jgi:hypothetical protein
MNPVNAVVSVNDSPAIAMVPIIDNPAIAGAAMGVSSLTWPG